MTERDDLHLLSGAYALDAVSDAERAQFEEYLATSEEGRAEVASLTDTAVLLGLAANAEEPPAALKSSLMAKIAVTPQLSVEPAPATAAVTSIFDAPSERAATTRRWYTRPATFMAAAAAVVAIALGGGAVAIVGNSVQQSQQASSFAAISAASDSQRAESAVAGGGSATLIWSNKLGRSAVVLSDLTTLPSNKTYELWYIDGTTITPAGTFVPGQNGSSVQVLQGAMPAGSTVGITVEPAGGSKQPTTKPVVAIATA